MHEVWTFGLEIQGTQFEIRSAELTGAEDRSLPLTLGREDRRWMEVGFSTARQEWHFDGLGLTGVPMIETSEGHMAMWVCAGAPPGVASVGTPIPESAEEEAEWFMPPVRERNATHTRSRALPVRAHSRVRPGVGQHPVEGGQRHRNVNPRSLRRRPPSGTSRGKVRRHTWSRRPL